MRVLITGAGGNLGRVLAPALVAAGHTPKLFDFRPLQTEYEFVQGDVRHAEEVRRAVEGVHAIVHAAALHGIHVSKWQPQDFWAINVSGTFNVFEAARMAGVQQFVLCSTMGVYGESMKAPQGAWGIVTDDSPTLPGDVYGMSKWLCEDLARYYARRWNVNTVALRLGMFVPESFERYGFRLLFGGVDDRDVAQAVLLALNYQPENGSDFFNIMADVPFTPEDAQPLNDDPVAVIEKYWRGTRVLIEANGLDARELIRGKNIWKPEKAMRVLGYKPQYNFGEFLQALRENNRAHYPFANLAWWGI